MADFLCRIPRKNCVSAMAKLNMPGNPQAFPIETILRAWLGDSDLTIFCGNWGDGSVIELLPRGGAQLSGPRYHAPFEGLRDLRIEGSAHHVHLDLGKLAHARYVMTPSVCYGFRPSFELRLTVSNADPLGRFGLGLGVTQPYAGVVLRTEPIRRYFCRAAQHIAAFPDAVSFVCNRIGAPRDMHADWERIESLLAEVDSASIYSMQALRTAMRRSDLDAAVIA